MQFWFLIAFLSLSCGFKFRKSFDKSLTTRFITTQSVTETANEIMFFYKEGNLKQIGGIMQKFASNLQDLESIYPLIDRRAFNTGLQTMIQKSNPSKIDQLLSSLQKHGYTLHADTINICLTDALWSRQDVRRADKLIRRFFSSGLVQPSSRSMNIMVEALRSAGRADLIQQYLEEFSGLGVKRDSFTFSTLVRVAPDSRSVSNILKDSLLLRDSSFNPGAGGSDRGPSFPPTGLLNGPLLRCAVETLGGPEIKDPENAFRVALWGFALLGQEEGEGGLFDARTGDALIVALLNHPEQLLDFNPKTTGPSGEESPNEFVWLEQLVAGRNLAFPGATRVLEYLQGKPCAEAVFSLFSRTHDSAAGGERAAASGDLGLRCSGKGYCLMFTFLQRQLRNTESQKASLRRQRDLLWGQVRGDILSPYQKTNPKMSPTSPPHSPAAAEERYKRSEVLLNGRLIDAVLRCYLDDVDSACSLWRSQLLPLCNLIHPKLSTYHESTTSSSSSSKKKDSDESRRGEGERRVRQREYELAVEMGLEALMFAAGLNCRADVGVTVARAVRTWQGRVGKQEGVAYRCAVLRQYWYGKKQGSLRPLFPLSDIASRGLENTMVLELGLMDRSEEVWADSGSGRVKAGKRIEKIRIQFK